MHGGDRSTADVEAAREAEGNAQVGDVLARDDDRSRGAVEAGGVVGPVSVLRRDDVHLDAVERGRRDLEVPGRRVVAQR